jgi:chromosome partitioning protein
MSTIIALAGQKGGSGKTTTALAIAAEWHARGCRVLLVDADPQGSTRTWGDLAAEAGHSAPTIVAMGAGLHRPDQLPALAQNYDFTVIDCPPRHGTVLRSALMVADLALLPCGPSAVDAWALGETLDLIAEARSLRPELKAAVVLTRKIARTVLGAGARKALAECGLPILRTELGYRVAYQEAPAAGLGVTVYDRGGAAADESRRLVDELEAVTSGERRRAPK